MIKFAVAFLLAGLPQLFVLAAPVLLALLVTFGRPRFVRGIADRLVPWAAAPALALSAWDGVVEVVGPLELPWLLLGVELGLTPVTRVFLLLSALLWLFAGLHARAYLHEDPRRRRFDLFFLATLTGNLGLVLARDVPSFYLCFALMTFAAYGLVVHSGTPAALRAGRAYIALAVLGEGALLAGLLLAARAGDGLAIDALPAAIAALEPGARALTVALLFAGFGVKAGVLALHVWLPLAHPVAPTPASAVLSGAMIKAGLLGWLQFLPLGVATLADAGLVVALLGLAAAFYGVAVGVAQDDPKTVLAYSSISQMGLMTLLVGAGLGDATVAPVAIAAAAFYALHHGLAKGALFLGVAAAQDARVSRVLLLAGLGLPALALAGAPFTSGALAKAELTEAIGTLPWAGAVKPLLYLGAAGTTLLMARFLVLVLAAAAGARGDARAPPEASSRASAHALPVAATLAWLATVVAALLAAWTLPRGESPVLALGTLWSAAWPVLLGLALAAAARRAARRSPAAGWTAWRVPPGDLLLVVTRGGPTLGRALRRAGERPWERLAAAWATVESGWRGTRRGLTVAAVRSERRVRAAASAMALVVLLAFVVAALG